jgi:hypothetical protein
MVVVDVFLVSLLVDPLLLPQAAAVRARATSGTAVRMRALRCMGVLLVGVGLVENGRGVT